MENERDDLITITDEDGTDIDMQIMDVVCLDGRDYAVLLPVDEPDGELVILEIISTEDDEVDELRGIDDEALLESVYKEFLANQEEQGDDE